MYPRLLRSKKKAGITFTLKTVDRELILNE